MKTTITASLAALTTTFAFLGATACSGDPAPGPATGGTPSTGGASSGGVGGATTGGTTTGGTTSGGASTGGASSGGAAGAATTGGGGGGGGAAAGAPGTFAQVGKILNDHCGISCHAAGTEQITLTNSDPAALYTRLTTPLPTNVCSGVTMVTPNLALTSLLTRAVKGAVNDANCIIPRMPNGCPQVGSCLTDADILTIQTWIGAGAKQQ